MNVSLLNPLRIVVFLSVGLLTLPSAHAQSNDFHHRLVGKWNIVGQQYSGSRVVASFDGKTSWELAHNGRYVHEQYEFDAGGQKLVGESHLGWSSAGGRYEYSQVDGYSPGMLWMTGSSSDEDHLIIESVGGRSMSIRYEFAFEDDDTLVVKLLIRRSDNDEWRLNSDYTYTRK